MNIGKAVAAVVVLAIVGVSFYNIFSDALPDNLTEMPMELESEGDVQTNFNDDMSFSIQPPAVKITSKLPRDVKDVGIDIYLGSGKEKFYVGTYEVGIIPGKGTATVPPSALINKISEDHQVKIPSFVMMTYLSSVGDDGSGNMIFPLCFKLSFKYATWAGEDLLDMGIALRVNTPCPGSFDKPHVEGNKVTMTATISDGMIQQTVKDLFDNYDDGSGKISFKAGEGADFDVSYDSATHKVTFIAEGSGDLNAADAMKKIFEEEGKLTISSSFGSEDFTYTIEDKGQFDAVYNAVLAFYGGAGGAE